MGNTESDAGFGMFHRSPDAAMRHNAQFANNFAHQHQHHKKQHEATVGQMANMLLLHKHPKDHGTGGRDDRRQVEIEGVNYEITEFINRGGFGQIYQADDRKRNRTVAMKIMNNVPGILEEIKNEIQFLRLTKIIELDNHPVIEYYGCKFTKESIFIAMELASCDLLSFWFKNAVHTEPQEKFLLGVIIIVFVLRALIFLEKLNIIHGDIKPQNLVIVQNAQYFYVKLIDFGTVEKMNTKSAQITVDAGKAHTVYFASPEFLRRNSNHLVSRHLHKKSDAWAAGVMFYILFFEKFPWKDEFDYENFCNNSHARDIVVPHEGGYKLIIELLLKKNPEERSSAKSTYLQMKGHPALSVIIKSFQQNFCSVDDVCYMKVPDDVRQELAKLLRPGHAAHDTGSSSTTTNFGPRRSCRYGRDCFRKDSEHRKEFAHPGDSDYHVASGAASGHLEKRKCRYGADCFRTDAEHRKKYIHPSGSSADHFGKPKCRYGKGCHDSNFDHLRKYSHPDDFKKEKCRFGGDCNKRDDQQHMANYWHD